MDAQSDLFSSSDNIEKIQSTNLAPIDTAYGILFWPGKTFEILSNSIIYRARNRAFLEGFIAFLLSAVISSFAKGALEPDRQSIVTSVILGTLIDLFTWLLLALLLRFLCGLFARPINWLSALIVTSWAFLPLIFTAPIACFVLANSACSVLLLVPLFWFSYLQLLAFESSLKLGKVKTFSLLMVMPPVIFFAFLFWFATFLFVLFGALGSSIG